MKCLPKPVSKRFFQCLLIGIFLINGLWCFAQTTLGITSQPSIFNDTLTDMISRQVVVAVYENYPKIYIDQDGTVSGIFPIILEEIARREHWQLTYIPCEWADCLENLKTGAIDLLPDVAFSWERDQWFDFHREEVVTSWSVAYSRSRKSINTIADLKGLRVALLKDSIQKDVLTKMSAGFGFSLNIIEADSYDEAFSWVASGQADIVISNQFYGDSHYTEYKLHKTPVVLNPAVLFFATASGQNADLLQAIDAHLREMKMNPQSVYYEVLQRWMVTSQEKIPLYIWEIIACVMIALLLALAYIIALRIQVYRKTQKISYSEKKFRNIFHHSSDAIFILSLTGQIIEVNDVACQRLGYSRDELLALSVGDINSPQSAQLIEARKQELQQTGKLIFESEHRCKNGQFIPVEVNATIIELENEKHMLSIARDISNRKQTEKALEESQEKYRLLLYNQSDLIVKVDTESRFLFASPNYCKTFGKTEKELLGKTFMPLVHEDDRARTAEEMKKLYVPPYQCLLEQRALTVHGWRWFEWADSSILAPDGQVVEIIGVGRDISKRKQVEEEREQLQQQLTQAQKMETVGRLAGGVAHDFNNMLSVILGYTELILHNLGPENPLQSDIVEIQKAAERSADLTRQLLAFARKQTILPQTLQLNNITESSLKMLRRLIGEDIDLSWNPGENIPLIYMDPSQLDQILVNLCVNARDAMNHKAGKITIETGTASFNEDYCKMHLDFIPGDYVLLAVSDNGCGIDKSILPNIFEPFFTTKTQDQGTGLGLASVYGVVKQNNGFIHVYSEPGLGSTFRIYLPPYHENEIQQHKYETAHVPHGDETILLVEDDSAILHITKKMLEILGYHVIIAQSPERALILVQEYTETIDLLITDVVMPGMNGRELADKIVALSPDIKLLFMSGYTASVIARHGVLDKTVHFIQKPFSMKKLGDKVKTALQEIHEERKSDDHELV